jgi:GNAT superfamily N-acetyltransferase
MPERALLRKAVAADDLILGELLVRAYEHQYARKLPDIVLSDQRLADLRDIQEKRANGTVLVAELDGRVIGTATLYPWGAPRSEAWIAGAADLRYMAVDTAFLGQGRAGDLLDAAEACARSWGAPALGLHVRRGAVGLAGMYQARGYVRDGGGDIDRRPQIFLEAFKLAL